MRKRKKIPYTQEYLAELFYIDDAGVLRYRRNHYMCKKDSPVGSKQPNGYVKVNMERSMFWAHRLVFFMCTGLEPDYIDHIDGDSSNNAIENLRACTQSQNGGNSKPTNNASSPYKGVGWHSAAKKWEAYITSDTKKKKYLGVYGSEEEAAKAYDRAAVERWGCFAKVNFPNEA